MIGESKQSKYGFVNPNMVVLYWLCKDMDRYQSTLATIFKCFLSS